MEGTLDYEIHENDTEKLRTNAPFASSIIYELSQDQDDGSFYLEIIFNGIPMKQPYCDNKTLCPLAEFLGFVEKNLLTHIEWLNQCNIMHVIE